MNVSVYLFGQLGDKYTQYPTDYTQSYFQEFERSVKAKTAIGIRCNGDLMLYQYIRRLPDGSSARGEYIGITVVYNGVMLKDLKPLFQIYEDTITNLVVSGKILQFTDSGDIVSTVGKLYQASSEFARISEYLSAQLNAQSALFEKLPPKNYAINEEQSKSFSVQDDMADIIEATRNYTKVYVLKDADYNSATLTSYSAKLRELNTAKELAQKTVQTQQGEIASLKRKQKNFRLVLLLTVIIFAGIIGILIYVGDTNTQINRLNTSIENLKIANNTQLQTIKQQRDSIGSLLQKTYQQTLEISTLTTQNEELITQNEQLDADLKQTTKQLSIANAKVEHLTAENQRQTSTIATLQNRLNNYASTSGTTTSSASYGNNIVGANISNSSTAGYDRNYALWLYAKKPVKINSFYVKSDKSGYITIGLYNTSHTLIASHKVYLSKGSITKVTPTFSISKGNYYLAIERSNGIGLSYHKSSASEYTKYQSGDLQIIGASPKGQQDIKMAYYQYFYYISYSLQ